MKCSSVIFDFNGSLFFDNDKHVKAWGKISQELRGKDITAKELHENCNGVPNNEVIRYLLQKDAPVEELNEISRRKERYYREFCKADPASFHLVAGAEELFDDLKAKGIPFTIASASIKDNIDFFVENFDLARWIQPENIVYDDGSYLDKVAMFHDAARILGSENMEDVVIVEDSLAGIVNGYKSGSNKLVVVNSAGRKEEFEKLPGVVQIIDDFTQMQPIEKI
jgi:beta-phosphoglucomutase-like phosphatase (HAD superfamily)